MLKAKGEKGREEIGSSKRKEKKEIGNWMRVRFGFVVSYAVHFTCIRNETGLLSSSTMLLSCDDTFRKSEQNLT